MARFADLSSTFYELQNTWSKVRADFISHFICITVIFGLFEVSLPTVHFLTFSPAALMETSGYKLLKETGFIFLLSLVPILVLLIYGLLLRTIGRWFVDLHLLASKDTESWITARIVTDSQIEKIGRTLDDVEFRMTDVLRRFSELSEKYRSLRKEEYTSYVGGLQEVRHNTSIYLGNSSIFLLVWISLFLFLPDTNDWRQDHISYFLPVTLFLLAIVLWARIRLNRISRFFLQYEIMVISLMIDTDPELQPIIEESSKKHPDLLPYVAKIRQHYQESKNRPSLRNYVAAQFGWNMAEDDNEHTPAKWEGWPLNAQYRRGHQFSWNTTINQQYDKSWLKGYRAYLYYRSYNYVHRLLKRLIHGIIYFFTGRS